MLDRELVVNRVASFKTKHGVQDRDEHVVTTIHLMNTHRLDLSAAQDQTSHGANDRGIDGWHYDPKSSTLTLYQSKLTESKVMALKGCDELVAGANWIGTVLQTGDLGGMLTNAALYNLARCLDHNKNQVRNVLFYLISPFNPNELLDRGELEEARRDIVRSPLNAFITERSGRIDLQPQAYNLDPILPTAFSSYEVTGTAGSELQVGKRTQLRVLSLRLASLVELYRRRGNRLFEKNVRLFLNTKESRTRLEHPLEDTLDRICSGQLDPNVFPLYHIGVTITAGGCEQRGDEAFSLETPNVINGCQTINIADRYLRRLEKEKAAEKIERFGAIPVLAKVVISATDDQVREIANCNNRQNPIEAWQLFSNEPVHVQIEQAFEQDGVFYERQKGKFEAEMKNAEALNRYHSTNGTRITVVELGQLITLCRRQLHLAAKPSEVFASQQAHDAVFEWGIPERHVTDAVFAFNALKAVKRGLQNYLRLPIHDNEATHSVFVKPLVRQMLYYAAIMHLYQRLPSLTTQYAQRLNKISPPNLTTEAEGFYRKVVAKTKTWYLAESQQNQVEVSSKKLESFLDQLCHENGLDIDGMMPFTANSMQWTTTHGADDDLTT